MKKRNSDILFSILKICLLLTAVILLAGLSTARAEEELDYSVTAQPYTAYKTLDGSKKGLAVGAPSQAIEYNCDICLFNLPYTYIVTTEDTGMFLYSYEGEDYYFDDSLVLPMRLSIQDYKAENGGQLVIIKMYSLDVVPGLTYSYKPDDSTCVSLDCEHCEDNIKTLFDYLGRYLGTCTDYWIIGNEIDAADNYNFSGGIENRTVEFYGKMYAYLMKDLYNVMVCYNGNVSLLISFDQAWNVSSSDHYSTKELISVIQNKLNELGDFCWGLAPQSYNVAHVDIPSRYATPIWWNDKTTYPDLVTESYDTPFIVLDNFDVLISYMQQNEMLYEGKIRPIIITEIGFSRYNNGEEDEDAQVAAFERFHTMAMETPELISYIYNNQADGGGVWFNMDGHKLQKVFTAAGVDVSAYEDHDDGLDSKLDSVTVDGTDIADYDPDISDYSVTVDPGDASVLLDASAYREDSDIMVLNTTNGQTLTCDGTVDDMTLELERGTNEIEIYCTAEDGCVSSYTLTINRPVRYGDVDGDGDYTLIDIVYIRRHILGMETLSGSMFEAADIDGDGAVDLVDLVYIRGYLLGTRTEIPQR